MESLPSRGFRRASGGIAPLERLLHRLVGSLRPKVEWLHVEVGLGDPADTGQAWAFLGPLSALAGYHSEGMATFEPNFEQAVFAVDCRARFTLVPLQVIAIALAYLFSPATLRGLIAAQRVGSA